jgi:hypothetical protein
MINKPNKILQFNKIYMKPKRVIIKINYLVLLLTHIFNELKNLLVLSFLYFSTQ